MSDTDGLGKSDGFVDMTKGVNGERIRVLHALERLEAMIVSVRLAVKFDAPIGSEGPQALLTTAGEIAMHSAAADAYWRAERS